MHLPGARRNEYDYRIRYASHLSLSRPFSVQGRGVAISIPCQRGIDEKIFFYFPLDRNLHTGYSQ